MAAEPGIRAEVATVEVTDQAEHEQLRFRSSWRGSPRDRGSTVLSYIVHYYIYGEVRPASSPATGGSVRCSAAFAGLPQAS